MFDRMCHPGVGLQAFLLVALVLLSGCHGSSHAKGPGGVVCNNGFVDCGGTCVDKKTDLGNCGTCGNACAQGLSCIDSGCACPGTTLLCDDRCIDPLSSAGHCGAHDDCTGTAAGTACPDDQTCVSGACICPQGWLVCGGKCVDPTSNLSHCGATGDCTGDAAGATCSDAELCQTGVCTCRSGLLRCDGACIDPRASGAHCGASGDCTGAAAGEICPANSTCTSGDCVCTTGLLCDGECVDPAVSAAHCGASGDCSGPGAGTVCQDPQNCLAGICANRDTSLASLVVTRGEMSPAFAPGLTDYDVALDVDQGGFEVTAAPTSADASFTIDGLGAIPSDSRLFPLDLGASKDVAVVVTAPGGASRRYVLHAHRLHIFYLKPSNNDPEYAGMFGTAVALSGDTLAVGAPREAGGSTGINGDPMNQTMQYSGAVYVFHRLDGQWAQEAYIKASNTSPQAMFGTSVSLLGDTMVVGAPGESSASELDPSDQSASSAGAAYVFTRTNGVWSQQAYLKAPIPAPATQFGTSVSMADGELAVGALYESDATTLFSGAVHVFTRVGTGWVEQSTVRPDLVSSGQTFGQTVSLSGDRLAAVSLADRAVYVFARTGDVWAQEDTITRDGPLVDGYTSFGSALALQGDTLAVGASHASTSVKDGGKSDPDLLESGAVWVFRRANDAWAEEGYLKASNTYAGAQFGQTVALSGDRLLVGAIGEASDGSAVNGDQTDNSDLGAGAAYLFVRGATAWTQLDYIKALSPSSAENFGCSVAMDGKTYAVGVCLETSGSSGVDASPIPRLATPSGAVYIY